MFNIGNRIRDIRKQKEITLIELSKMTGVAQATLSRIETGDMLGTIECHLKVANALGISLSELYDGLDDRTSKTHHSKKNEPLSVSSFQGDKVRVELRTSKALKKKLFPTVITLKGNSETEDERAEKSVEKFIYVIDGDVVVNLNKQDFHLKQDESLYFDGSLPHRIINKASKIAKVIAVSSPPA